MTREQEVAGIVIGLLVCVPIILYVGKFLWAGWTVLGDSSAFFGLVGIFLVLGLVVAIVTRRA